MIKIKAQTTIESFYLLDFVILSTIKRIASDTTVQNTGIPIPRAILLNTMGNED